MRQAPADPGVLRPEPAAATPAESVLPSWEFPKLSVSFVAVAVFLLVIHSYRINVGQVAMVFGVLGLLLEQGRFRFPPGFVWCVLFFIWAALSVIVSDMPGRSWEPLMDYGKVVLIGVVVANALSDASKVSGFLILWLGCFALWPVRGTLLNFAYGIGEGGRYHWNYIFQNPNDLASIVLLMLGLTLAAARSGSSRRLRVLATVGTVLLTLIVFLTQSRGAFLGLTVFGLFAITTHRRRSRALLGMAVLAALIFVTAPSSVWQRLGGLKNVTSTETIGEADVEGSATARYAIWQVSLAIARDHPVTGIGFGSYPEAHNKYSRQSSEGYKVRGDRDTHSAYLNALAETGVPGLIALLGFVIGFGLFLARMSWRLAKQNPKRAEQFKYLLAGWLAFWVSAFFGTFHRIVFPYLFAGFGSALASQYGLMGSVVAARIRAPSPPSPAGVSPLWRGAARR